MPDIRRRILILLIVMASVTAGCGTPASPVQGGLFDPEKRPPIKSAGIGSAVNISPLIQETMQVTIYHGTNDAMYLIPEIYVVPKNDHPAQTAIELLVAGTKNTALTSVIPPGTKLKNLWIKDHIAYANFNDQLIKKGTGGSTSEVLLVSAIVNTLTLFPNIQKVQILVDGKKIDTIFGHMDTGQPLNRLENIIKNP